MFALRSFIEAAKIALGTHVRQQPQTDFADAGFELFSLANGAPLLPITKAKAYKTPRDVRLVDLIVVHVTAVRGGFGVAKSAVKKFDAIVDDGMDDLPVELAQQLLDGDGQPLPLTPQRLALWARFKNVPYHQIAARNGDCLANHPLSRHSWHGNGGNTGVGFAVDCAPDEKLDDWMIETGRKSLSILIARLQRETMQPVIRIAPHRAFSASRRNDTGPYVWKEVIEPVVMHTPGVRIDYEVKRDGGLPVPKSWDTDAHYDDKGKRVQP